MNNQEKGITLIALAITIIVLMILTAVSMQAFSEDGLVFQIKGETQNQTQKIDRERRKMDEVKQKQLEDWGF